MKVLNVRGIRKRTGLSENEFCILFGFEPPQLRSWEKGYTQPKGFERMLLLLIEHDPETVAKIVREDNESRQASVRQLLLERKRPELRVIEGSRKPNE